MKPYAISSRREMFVDDLLIDRAERVSLRLAAPERRDVSITGDAPWEDWTFGALSLVQADDGIRLYYRAAIPDLKDENISVIAMAVSTDGGRTFERPNLGMVEFNGSKDNNILWRGGRPGVPPAFIDTNPNCPDDQRFKGLGMEWGKLYVLGSADGMTWRDLHDGPVDMAGTFDTINTAFWDTQAGCYRSYTRVFADPVTGEPYVQDKVRWDKAARAIQTSTSPDFIHWSPPRCVTYADGDLAMEMYTNDVIPCPGAEHIYVGFPNRYMGSRTKPPGQRFNGVNDALFMASRDGVHWTRYREAWIRPGRDPRNWTQRNNYPAWGIIRESDESWSMLVSEHYMQPDGTPPRLRRYRVRPWGFVSIHADFDGGSVTTKPILLEGSDLRLNYATSAAGSVKVELLNVEGNALPGYSAADMQPIYGDEIDAVATWGDQHDLSALRGKVLRLRFTLKDADLFAIRSVGM